MKKTLDTISYLGGLTFGFAFLGTVVFGIAGTIAVIRTSKKLKEQDPYEHY